MVGRSREAACVAASLAVVVAPGVAVGTPDLGTFTPESFPAGTSVEDPLPPALVPYSDGVALIHREGVGLESRFVVTSTGSNLDDWLAWPDPVNPTAGASIPAVTVLPSGELGVWWTAFSVPIEVDGWFRRMSPTSSSVPTLVMDNPVGEQLGRGVVQAVGESIWCAWLSLPSGGGTDVLGAISRDGGMTFDDPALLPFPAVNIDTGPFAVVRDETIHVITYEQVSFDERRLWSFAGAGDDWTELPPPFPESLYPTAPVSFAVNEEGTLGLLVPGGQEAGAPWPHALYFVESHDGGQTWSTPLALAKDPEQNHYDPKLATGPDGSWHAAWNLDSFTTNLDVLYSVRRPGEAWSEPVRANPRQGSVEPSLFWGVQLAVATNGRATMVWQEDVRDGDSFLVAVSTLPEPAPPVGSPAAPNPFRTFTRVVLGDETRAFQVLDVAGRLVDHGEADDGVVVWDGHEATPGVYFIRAAREPRQTTRVVFLGAAR